MANIRDVIRKEAADRARWQRDWEVTKGANFVPAGTYGDAGTVFVVDEARKRLLDIAQNFPGQFKRTLGKIGSELRKELRAAIESGGPAGSSWPRKVLLDQAANAKYSPWIRGKTRRKYRKRDWKGLVKHFGGAPDASEAARKYPFGLLHKAGRYRLAEDGHSVQIGWIGWSASSHFRSVQAGMRGKKLAQEYDGEQPVTRSMRRAFAAAGIILSKSKRSIRQGQRPLMRRMFQSFEPRIPDMINHSVARYIAEGKSS